MCGSVFSRRSVGSPGFISEGSDVRRKAPFLLVGVRSSPARAGKDNKQEEQQQVVEAATEAAAPRTVNVDGQTDKFNSAFLAYFPNEVQVRPVTRSIQGDLDRRASPVTMARSSRPALRGQGGAAERPRPRASRRCGDAAEGPGDANQTARAAVLPRQRKQPTTPPGVPKVPQPAFNGRQGYYNSGFLPEGKTFSVKLADDVSPERVPLLLQPARRGHVRDDHGQTQGNRDPSRPRSRTPAVPTRGARQQDRRPHTDAMAARRFRRAQRRSRASGRQRPSGTRERVHRAGHQHQGRPEGHVGGHRAAHDQLRCRSGAAELPIGCSRRRRPP